MRSFLKIFEKIGAVKKMSLYDFEESRGFPGFGIMMMTENFQRIEKCDNIIIALYMYVRKSSDFFDSCCATFADIKS